MTTQAALSLVILAAAVALFVSQRWSTDVVSLLVMLSTMLGGLLTPAEAFASFANPVVITIASILVVSAALFQTGVAARLGRLIVQLAGDSEWRLIAALMIAAALLSAVMNNVAVVAVLMPVVLDISLNTGRSTSRLLLPMAYAAVVGGTLTLIGSPPNLIASQALTQGGHAPLGLLDITPIGALSTLTALVFMVSVGRRLLPDRSIEEKLLRARLPSQLIDLYRVPERVFCLQILPQSPLVGQTLGQSCLGSEYGLTMLGIINQSGRHMSPPTTQRIDAGDRLLTQGGPQRIRRAATDQDLSWQIAAADELDLTAGDIGVAEVTLPPRSSLAGKTLRELQFRQRFGLTVLALWRSGEPVERNIGEEPLHVGDAFLVQGPWRRIRLLHDQSGLLVISEDEKIPRRTDRAPLAIAILLVMLASVVARMLPLPVAALGAAVLTVLTGCLHIDEARNAIDWQVVFLIAGTLTLAAAMQKTGATQWIALTILSPVASLGPLGMTGMLLLITTALTLSISNYATAALVAPIALSAAMGHGLDPRPQLLAVAVGTTVALFSPFPHPGLMLVMGPGSYKFRDYLRVGLPLGVLIFAATWVGLALLQLV